MSITFLQEPNAYKEIADVRWLGQTITLEYTTRLYYFYFERYWGGYRKDIYCDVYLTDESHHPVGNPIASASDWIKSWEKHQRRARDVFSFWGVTLETGTEYFFLFHDDEPTTHINTRIYTREGDSTYLDGKLYYSENSGETWTEFPDDDIVFALTGKVVEPPEPPVVTPDIPPPAPPAPINNFAILDIIFTATSIGMKIEVVTSVPCHLYCYWTNHEPGKHLIPILDRGIALHTHLEMCFVEWTENEQDEAGDTLVHTFIKEPWAVCETRWLTFRAKVMNEWVKSVGPIFKKHRVLPPYGPPITVKFYSDGDPEVTSVDGYVRHAEPPSTWTFLVNAAGNLAVDDNSVLVVGYVTKTYPGDWWLICRSIMLVDTLELPADCQIDSAKIALKTQSIYWLAGGLPTFNVFSSNPASDNALIPTDYATCGSTPFSNAVGMGDFLVNTFTDFPLNAAGLANITKAGISKFSIREESYDVPDTPPPWLAGNKTNYWRPHSAEANLANRPYLEVTYREQI